MPSYYEKCGGGAPLNTIVMAGSHDAGITGGADNVQTQTLDIGEQARAGVRLFDLRIAAFSSGVAAGGGKQVEMRAYHADGLAKKQETKDRFVKELGRNEVLERSKLRAGAYGQTLSTMLMQAGTFVATYPTEFLILKFDKCYNQQLIAEACVTLLPGLLYTGCGNINLKTLDELKGRVIVLFSEKGLANIGPGYAPANGILGIKNCNAAGESYSNTYQGLQYYGKGGTSLLGVTPVKENRKKQSGLMSGGAKSAQSNPDVIGMMYWTSTGMFGDINKRNEKMWGRTNTASLQRTWENGLKESIDERINKNQMMAGFGGRTTLKTFMPNIVMIDFANEDRCRTIFDLNDVAATELARLWGADADSDASRASEEA